MKTIINTLKATITCNGNIKKLNDVAERRNVPRYRDPLTYLLLYALCSMLFAFCCLPLSLEAKVTGVCSNCHTMHNSQNGQAVAYDFDGISFTKTFTPKGNLLIYSCLGCHSSTGTETILEIGGNKIPIVFNTGGYPSNPLAGGNFYYVSLGGAENDAKGHNIFSDKGDGKLSMAPGRLINCGTNNCHTNLHLPVGNDVGAWLAGRQGCTKCHMVSESDDPPGNGNTRGFHHANDGTGTKYVDTAAKGWYRFLSGHLSGSDHGIKGIEDENWQYTYSSTDHNEYLGDEGVRGSFGFNGARYSMTSYCTGCHAIFSQVQGSASPWQRHPSDFVIRNSGEYAAISTTYNPDVPVARSEAFLSTLGNTPDSTVQAGRDMVMCLSCHRAHGSPYFKMMRWDYKGWPGNGQTNGCSVCHTSKN